MQLSDFDFHLPEALIATRPAKPRSSARLLVAEGAAIRDRRVTDLLEELRPGDRLVLNNTKVIPARLNGQRWRDSAQGRVVAKVEVTNNGKDDSPVWEDATTEARNGRNHLFTNQTAANGFAFNFRVTAERGASGESGYIASIQGGFQ